MLTSESFTHK